MRTEAIKKSIINNFRILSEKSNIQSKQSNVRPVWGLNYSPKGRRIGFVSEVGYVERKGTNIDIRKDTIITHDKPFYMTWKHALKNINSMLENIIKNYDNDQMVEKKCLNIICPL